MTFYVKTGKLKKKVSSDSPKQAAIDFLAIENGPFAHIIGVYHKGFPTKKIPAEDRDCFFWVETLLSENRFGSSKRSLQVV